MCVCVFGGHGGCGVGCSMWTTNTELHCFDGKGLRSFIKLSAVFDVKKGNRGHGSKDLGTKKPVKSTGFYISPVRKSIKIQ